MRWFDRFSRLLKADAHAVLEQLEEKSLLVKQHLREAELELDRKRARCEALEEEGRSLADEVIRTSDAIASLDEDVELALSGNKEELARYAVRRLLPKRRALEDLTRRRDEVVASRARLEATLLEQQAQFEELECCARRKLAEQVTSHSQHPEPRAADEEVELELLRRRAAPAGEVS